MSIIAYLHHKNNIIPVHYLKINMLVAASIEHSSYTVDSNSFLTHLSSVLLSSLSTIKIEA